MDKLKELWYDTANQTKLVVGLLIVGLIALVMGVSSKPELEDYTQIQKEALAVRKEAQSISVDKEIKKIKINGIDVQQAESDATTKAQLAFQTAYGALKDDASYDSFTKTYKNFFPNDFFEDVKSQLAGLVDSGGMKWMPIVNTGVNISYGKPNLLSNRVPVFIKVAFKEASKGTPYSRYYLMTYDFQDQRFVNWEPIQAKIEGNKTLEGANDEN